VRCAHSGWPTLSTSVNPRGAGGAYGDQPTQLASEDGRSTLDSLARRADVMIESFRPGVLDRLGFSATALQERNPRLIILSISGFGHDGPAGACTGYDQIAQGEAGLRSLTGPGPSEPTQTGVPIAGMYGAYGVAAALAERSAAGRGRVVRTSLLAAVVGTHAFQGTKYIVGGRSPGQSAPTTRPSVHRDCSTAQTARCRSP
jgi:crotonobetainyl-CoA:carnitine CoA-transferase CaiB-like acyl-CoA transferase